MDTVLVTGGLGGAGSWIVERFAERGTHVVCLDQRRPESGRENVSFYAVDLTEQGETWELVHEEDPDAVVHFAAIPDPLSDPGTRVFENNVESTYNVLVAAGRVGAEVAWASSESAYGFPFADPTPLPDYLPVDESHPMRPEDPYGTSKVTGEEIAGMVTRRYGVPVTSIRPSWIQYPGRYFVGDVRENTDLDDPGRSGNFWSYVDVRDVASMVEAALDADREGHEAFLAHAAENYVGAPTADLVEAGFGDLPEECALSGEESAFTTAKARDLLGWEPSHDWRTAEDEDVPGPSFVG
ncbi:MAG: NAD-dependent epimerase/dehydratase family protein [Halobacteriaceae archaeon]